MTRKMSCIVCRAFILFVETKDERFTVVKSPQRKTKFTRFLNRMWKNKVLFPSFSSISF